MTHHDHIRVIETYGYITTFSNLEMSLYVKLVSPKRRISKMVNGDYNKAIEHMYNSLKDRMYYMVSYLEYN